MYIYFRDNTQFWTWITFIIGNHIGGWRWTGLFWDHFEIDIIKIDSVIFYTL